MNDADQSWNCRVTGSMGHLGHLSRLGHRVIIVTGMRPEYFPIFQFSNKCSKCTAYILNANVIKVNILCGLLFAFCIVVYTRVLWHNLEVALGVKLRFD